MSCRGTWPPARSGSPIGYLASLVIGIAIGVAIGSFRSVEAFVEPQLGFLRYIPASALTPLLLIWLGIDEAPKLTLIVLGTVFYIALMIGRRRAGGAGPAGQRRLHARGRALDGAAPRRSFPTPGPG